MATLFRQFITGLFFLGPLLFAVGFLTPLIAQIIERMGWLPPFGLTPLVFGILIASVLGIIAQVRGRWV